MSTSSPMSAFWSYLTGRPDYKRLIEKTKAHRLYIDYHSSGIDWREEQEPKKLGGSFSKAKEVWWLGEKCFAKYAFHDTCKVQEFIKMIDQELDLFQTLPSHPCLVFPYRISITPTMKIVQVMPFMEGGSLADKVKNPAYLASLTPKAVLQMLWRIASGISYLHECGAMYRDAKLENVLLDESGLAYVCDFNTAKILETTTVGAAAQPLRFQPLLTTDTVVGTIGYISQEVFPQSRKLINRLDSDNPKEGYTMMIDTFSFGKVMLHVSHCEVPKDNNHFCGESCTLPGCCKTFTPFLVEALDGNPMKRPEMNKIAIKLLDAYQNIPEGACINEACNGGCVFSRTGSSSSSTPSVSFDAPTPSSDVLSPEAPTPPLDVLSPEAPTPPLGVPSYGTPVASLIVPRSLSSSDLEDPLPSSSSSSTSSSPWE
eukprot:TRINITY_DN4900_c0_g1_i3.p1 TRINITY_DN4900_c0_g1~~TRINITY_DN4900_c0_g1_i3.p1  ORF type:complete len:428 (-),score=58.18 TRINITY_DN4900_c0_g1_i3:173-1456(-)